MTIQLSHDLRYALRQLRKSPVFTATAVLTLALGMGANTAVFSVMNAVLLRRLPVRDPQRLFYLHLGNGQGDPPSASDTGNSNTSFSEPVFEALRQRDDVFADLIAYVPLGFAKTAVRYKEVPEEARGDEVSGNFFSGLSAGIINGRSFSIADEKGHAPVVVISYDYWTRRFARNPSVLGETLYIKNIPFSIIGITVSGFRGVEPASSTDFWIPLQNRPELNAWGLSAESETLYGTPQWWCLPLMARLRPRVTPAQAQTALQSTFAEAAKIGIGSIDLNVWKPLLDFVPAKGIEGYNQQYRRPVQILMGLVLLVLLIACVNVALLLMARNEARQREFSLKIAIGAGRAELFRQLLSESALLVAGGAAVGWAFASVATRALAAWSGIESGLDPDRNVLLFTLGISVLSALAFGFAPLLLALRAPVSGVLRATTTNVVHHRNGAANGRMLMSFQVGVCLLLLIAALLLLRTIRNYDQQDLGMNGDDLLVFGVTPQNARTTQETFAFYQSLIDRIRVLPDVEAATIMENRLGSGWSDNNNYDIDGVDLSNRQGNLAMIRSNNVGPNYFHVVQVPILQGRDISDSDIMASQPVAVVNETFVKRFLPNTNPLGHTVWGKDRRIVGVVKDSKYTGVDEPPMSMAFFPAFQLMNVGETMQIEIRTHSDPMNFLPSIRRVVHDLDPGVPLESPLTQRAQFELSYSQPKMFARLGGFFGGLAALLVATGLYGTCSYRTNRRISEIGVRIALGARPRQVVWIVLRESVLICALGSAVGLSAAIISARILNSMLYQLSPLDPLSFVLATCCVVLVGGIAALLPAWRAAKVDPMVALRYE
jgi:predicted permease